jgi:hypothetical protein
VGAGGISMVLAVCLAACGGTSPSIVPAATPGAGSPAGGGPDGGALSGSGEWNGRGDEGSLTGLTSAIITAGLVLAMAHATAAEQHWKSGACLRLDVAPPEPRVAGGDGSLTLTVTATSTVDEAQVDGSVEVKAATGTFDPTSARAPASITATIDKNGEASAEVTFRSLRGIAIGPADVTGGDYALTFRSTATYGGTGLDVDTTVKAAVTLHYDSADGLYRGTGTLAYTSFKGTFTSGPAALKACSISASTTDGTISVVARLDPSDPGSARVWLAPGQLSQGIPAVSCPKGGASVMKDWPGWTPSFTQAAAKRQRTIDGNGHFYEYDGFAAGTEGSAFEASGKDTGPLGPLSARVTWSIVVRRATGS